MPKVSVIIPIYGVEKYIERCSRSLFEQTIDDIEYIFIDDCTNDNSISILHDVIKDYPERKNQIIIIYHEVNKGLPQARKTGLLHANGEYIAHCDSDDWVDCDYYQKMYEKGKIENADLVISDFYRTDGLEYKRKCRGVHSLNAKMLLMNLLYQKDPWSVWNKIFKRSCYEEVIFPLYSMGEDMALTLQLLRRCEVITNQRESCYHYFYNKSSISKSPSPENVINRFKGLFDNVGIVKSVYANMKGIISPFWYLDMLTMSALYDGVKDASVCKLVSRTKNDILQILYPKGKSSVKFAYIYCLFYSLINKKR